MLELVAVIVVVCGLWALIKSARDSPCGYEDEKGFHLVEPGEEDGEGDV